jgi:hypothetical protein
MGAKEMAAWSSGSHTDFQWGAAKKCWPQNRLFVRNRVLDRLDRIPFDQASKIFSNMSGSTACFGYGGTDASFIQFPT